MIRSELKRSTKPMQRSPLRVTAAAISTKRRKAMKSSRPKMTPIRKSARGESCEFGLAGICNENSETTVLCHRNGAGMGMKAPDHDAAYGCSSCHDVMDGRAPRPAGMSYEAMLEIFEGAIQRTQEKLQRKGLLAQHDANKRAA